MKVPFKIAFLLGLLAACAKDPATPTESSRLLVNTLTISAITQNTAVSGVQITGGFSSDVVDKGVCWASTTNPTMTNNKLSGGTGSGFAGLTITGLIPGTAYYVRAYVTTRNETIYGNQQQFTTLPYQLATVSTTSVTNVTLSTAIGGGNVSVSGGGTVTARGICWSSFSGPTIASAHTSDGNGLGAYSSSLSGLNPGTLYYVRAYATNQAGTAYGPQLSFTTVSIVLPTISAASIGTVGQTSAVATATVSADGGGAVTAKGVCWSTVSVPTIANSYTIDGTGLGAYSSTISGLSPGTTYYVRTYATNPAGTAYGAQVSFTTVAIQLATVSSVTISSITKTSASASGSVTADGGGAVSSRGICWSTGSNPTVPASSNSSNGSGTGATSASLTGLVTGTTYYVRAYAINAAGTAYGPLSSFKTL